MITPRPEKGPQNVTNEGVESRLWRRVLAIANTYEESWYQDRSIDPVAFAKRHPEIPHDILSQELTRLRDELVSDHPESVAPTQAAHPVPFTPMTLPPNKAVHCSLGGRLLKQ